MRHPVQHTDDGAYGLEMRIGGNGWSCQGLFDEQLVRLLRMSYLERQQAYFQ